MREIPGRLGGFLSFWPHPLRVGEVLRSAVRRRNRVTLPSECRGSPQKLEAILYCVSCLIIDFAR